MDSNYDACGLPAYEKDDLDRKIIEHFPGKIVRKDLTSLMKRGAGIPTYVLEYLLGMYCATDDEAAIADGMARIRKILAENYVRPEESEKIKSRIRELGQYTVIDKVSARLDEYRDLYVAQFTNLNIEPFVMPDEYVRQHTKILTGGIWCASNTCGPMTSRRTRLPIYSAMTPTNSTGGHAKGAPRARANAGPRTPLSKSRALHPSRCPASTCPSS